MHILSLSCSLSNTLLAIHLCRFSEYFSPFSGKISQHCADSTWVWLFRDFGADFLLVMLEKWDIIVLKPQRMRSY